MSEAAALAVPTIRRSKASQRPTAPPIAQRTGNGVMDHLRLIALRKAMKYVKRRGEVKALRTLRSRWLTDVYESFAA